MMTTETSAGVLAISLLLLMEVSKRIMLLPGEITIFPP